MPIEPILMDADEIRAKLGDSPQKRRVAIDSIEKMSEEEKKRRLEYISSEEIKAKYKIEILFGKNRSISALKLSTGAITIWESGKRFHGGGDQKMYWCGYRDCGQPITDSNFGYFHVVCPKCMKEQFLDPDSQTLHVHQLKKDGKPYDKVASYPCVVGERFFKMSPAKIAELLEKLWFELDCTADIYLKYHPTDIRYDPKYESTKTIDHLHMARANRGVPTIYPLKNIIKDTSNGASVRKRFLALVTA